MEAIFLSFIFMLAVFLGFELISKIPSTLHTPLMSGANAISGVSLIAALVSSSDQNIALYLSGIATCFATINVVGGYFVTDRMLKMFQEKVKENS